MKNKIQWFTLLAVLCIGTAAMAGGYGPEGKKFGVGIVLGDPTGFTMKGYLTEKFAVDGTVAWSLFDESLDLLGDVTYEFLEIPVDTTKITLPFYAGGGARIGFDKGGRDNGRTVVGIRIPVGLAVQWTQYPVEIFLEVAPGMTVAPATRADVTGGLGARFYF